MLFVIAFLDRASYRLLCFRMGGLLSLFMLDVRLARCLDLLVTDPIEFRSGDTIP